MPAACPQDAPPGQSLTWVARIGRAMQRNQRSIMLVQWMVVALYAFLLIAPAFVPPHDSRATTWNNLRLFAQFVFWGLGWPLVMLSMMVYGRAWCGIFCPDGTITEFASRHGRKQSIPRWMRWPGWPCAMLIITTLYGQLVGVYNSHPGTLLLLGLPTLGALWAGYSYANGKRVWCMYLCPANGVFSLLAKISPLHFRVDEEKCKQHPLPLPKVDCPPLIDIRKMKSASACHACGRCSGYLDAVELAARPPGSEILGASGKNASTAEALTLLVGVLGICTAAMHWSKSAAFAHFKHWLGAHAFNALEQYTLPWWLLAGKPETHTLLDGLSMLLYIAGTGCLLGAAAWLALAVAARLPDRHDLRWQQLSLALIPTAGAGTVVGLSALGVSLMARQGLILTSAPHLQAGFLALGFAFSAWLGWRLIIQRPTLRAAIALAIFLLPLTLVNAIWLDNILG